MEIDRYLKNLFEQHPFFTEKNGVVGYQPIMPTDEHDGGICLKIESEKFTGEVVVVLDPLDLFDIKLYKYDYTGKPINSVNYIHINDLFGAIETLLENPGAILESKVVGIITEELKKSDVIDIIKKDKDVENRVKEIVRTIVKDMYRILYQHNDIFKALGK